MSVGESYLQERTELKNGLKVQYEGITPDELKKAENLNVEFWKTSSMNTFEEISTLYGQLRKKYGEKHDTSKYTKTLNAQV